MTILDTREKNRENEKESDYLRTPPNGVYIEKTNALITLDDIEIDMRSFR